MIQRPTFASNERSSLQRPTYQPDSPSGVSIFGEELKRLTGDCMVRMVKYSEEEVAPGWHKCAQYMRCDDIYTLDLEVCCPSGQAIENGSALSDGCVPIPQWVIDKYGLNFTEESPPPSAPPSASNCVRVCKDHGGGCITDSGAEMHDSFLKPGQKAYQIVCKDGFVFESFGDKDASGNLVFESFGDILDLGRGASLDDSADVPGAETTSEDKKKSSVGLWVLVTLGVVGVGAAGWWYSKRPPANNPTPPPPARPRSSTSLPRPLPSRPSLNGVSSW